MGSPKPPPTDLQLETLGRTQSESLVGQTKRLLRVAGQAALAMPPRYSAGRIQCETEARI
jgi:hypothetical protein